MIERDIAIVKLESDLGANPLKAGASYGPEEFLKYDRERLGLFNDIPSHSIKQEIARDNYHALISNAKYIDAIYKHLNHATEKILELLNENKFPFVISGDHSNGAATIAALRAYQPDAKIGVIWIDAHADLHTPYTTPSGNMHGMPVAMSLFNDNIKNQKHELAGDGLQYWEKLKNLGVNDRGNILANEILFIDIRDLEEEEWDLINTYSIKYLSNAERKAKGIEYIIEQAESFASDFDHIYISFDIDSLDASLVPGTGTPVEEGLSLTEAGILLNRLYGLKNLRAFEISEINPVLEHEKTLKNVYHVIKDMARVHN